MRCKTKGAGWDEKLVIKFRWLNITDFIADGHHKLIRWKLVVHAGIDGFSRLIVFIAQVTTVHQLCMNYF